MMPSSTATLRESLAVEPRAAFRAYHVVEALDRITGWRGLLKTIRCDNGQCLPASRTKPRLSRSGRLLPLEAIGRDKAVSDEAISEMAALMAREVIDNGLRGGLPEGVLVSHNTGNWSDATHDAVISVGTADSRIRSIATPES